jgi:hypothetical protein
MPLYHRSEAEQQTGVRFRFLGDRGTPVVTEGSPVTLSGSARRSW